MCNDRILFSSEEVNHGPHGKARGLVPSGLSQIIGCVLFSIFTLVYFYCLCGFSLNAML